MSAEESPDFTVRVSDRARHVRMTVTARDGLVVVVPRGWRGDASAVVDAKRAWAERALERVADRRALHEAGPAALIPQRVELRALERSVAVIHRPPAAGPARARRTAEGVVLSGDGDPAARLAALRRWLDREARDALPGRVSELADACGLTPTAVRVRHMRSRWGSCSSRGSVALSRNLVFLPVDLVDGLILHELAHLRHLDHSKAFWRSLSKIDPRASEHRRALRDGSRFVPAWADA